MRENVTQLLAKHIHCYCLAITDTMTSDVSEMTSLVISFDNAAEARRRIAKNIYSMHSGQQ